MPLPDPYYVSQKSTPAYTNVRKQWPTVLNHAIAGTTLTIDQIALSNEQKALEGLDLINQITKLKIEVESNARLSLIEYPNEYKESDIPEYNEYILTLRESSGNSDTENDISRWRSAPCLFTECYLYRRLAAIYQFSQYWSDYDCYTLSKQSAFRSSKPAVIELALRYRDLSHQLTSSELVTKVPKQARLAMLQNLFTDFVNVSVWGNAADLQMLANIRINNPGYQDPDSQTVKLRKACESNILVNDTKSLWQIFESCYESSERSSPTRIDIVLNTAGFELYTDIILALFLLDSNLVQHVVFHPKSLPCFVSDVINQDFETLVDDLTNPQFFVSGLSHDQFEALAYVADRFGYYWKMGEEEEGEGKVKTDGYIQGNTAQNGSRNGVQSNGSQYTQHTPIKGISIHNNLFWNTHHPFNTHLSPNSRDIFGKMLWNDLASSDLVVFKGDMNYRKLVGDLRWERDVPFKDAVSAVSAVSAASAASTLSSGKNRKAEGKEVPTTTLGESGLNIVAFRTIRSLALCGLKKGQEDELNRIWESQSLSGQQGVQGLQGSLGQLGSQGPQPNQLNLHALQVHQALQSVQNQQSSQEDKELIERRWMLSGKYAVVESILDKRQ